MNCCKAMGSNVKGVFGNGLKKDGFNSKRRLGNVCEGMGLNAKGVRAMVCCKEIDSNAKSFWGWVLRGRV